MPTNTKSTDTTLAEAQPTAETAADAKAEKESAPASAKPAKESVPASAKPAKESVPAKAQSRLRRVFR